MATLNPLVIDFDPNKDASNSLKHGVSLLEAVDIEWNDAVHWVDTRHDYGELRMCAIAYIGVQLSRGVCRSCRGAAHDQFAQGQLQGD